VTSAKEERPLMRSRCARRACEAFLAGTVALVACLNLSVAPTKETSRQTLDGTQDKSAALD